MQARSASHYSHRARKTKAAIEFVSADLFGKLLGFAIPSGGRGGGRWRKRSSSNALFAREASSSLLCQFFDLGDQNFQRSQESWQTMADLKKVVEFLRGASKCS